MSRQSARSSNMAGKQGKKIAERIQAWRKAGGMLQLNGLGLTEVPPMLRALHELESVDFGRNNLKVVPSWIGELTSLRLLSLSDNEIEELPPEIGNLRNLRGLSVSRNLLKSLPATLSAPPLEKLYVWGNIK